MRISDWSSDVCSSDLADRKAAVIVASAGLQKWQQMHVADAQRVQIRHPLAHTIEVAGETFDIGAVAEHVGAIEPVGGARGVEFKQIVGALVEIGRASCRERVCQYV